MAHSLLRTKLFVPPVRAEFVSRPRLIELLDVGVRRKLTLVAAPAGFGKTTLLSEWVHRGDGTNSFLPVAWLSLDELDNDPARFLTYFVAAFQTIEANLGEGVVGAFRSPQSPPIEAVLTSLINEIAAIPNEFTLILDDYHMIGAQAIHDALTFLLDHLPSQMHLVIATRKNPPLPLPKLRAGGHMTEIRAAALRFTREETTAFLSQAMGVVLSSDDVALLESRTEAGLPDCNWQLSRCRVWTRCGPPASSQPLRVMIGTS